MVPVNDKAAELARSVRVPPEGLAGRQPIRALLSAVLPDLPPGFLDSAAKFEECDSGRDVLAELRTLVAEGITAGSVPTLELYSTEGKEYSLRHVDGVVQVLVPKDRVCKTDPPPPAP
jgi:hypothetical protein